VDKPGSSQLSDLPIWQAIESIRDYRHIYTYRMVLGTEELRPPVANQGGRGGGRYDLAGSIEQFPGHEGKIVPLLRYTASTNKPPRFRRTQVLDVEIGRWSELFWSQRGDEGRTESLIQHRCKESALDHPHGVDERFIGGERNLDCPCLRIDG